MNRKNNDYIDAVIKVKVPRWQIGEECQIHFPDTMCIKGKCEEYDVSLNRPQGEWINTTKQKMIAGGLSALFVGQKLMIYTDFAHIAERLCGVKRMTNENVINILKKTSRTLGAINSREDMSKR